MLKSIPRALPEDVPEMPILDLELLDLVKDMAAGMSKEEVLATFSIKADDFNEDEVIYFDEFYAYGKGMAVHKVVNNLIDSTKGRAGQGACMAFLRRFAKEWESEIEGDSSGNFSFTFGSKAPPDLKAVE